MATREPNLRVALQSMGSVCRGLSLTPNTLSVYKGSMQRIHHKFDHPGGTEGFNIGSYVRAVGKDNGTGLIVAVNNADLLEEDTNRVYHQRVYQVHWLDMKDATGNSLYAYHSEEELAPSSRSVPKFTSQEEADAWMEQQTQPGRWVGKVQDGVDSSADIDVELRQMLEGESGVE